MQQKPVKFFMIGDSTMANKNPQRFPEKGWGEVFGKLFNPNVTVVNKAMNGRSTKSFMAEGRWDEVMNNLKSGDYVFIQFGHNDEKISSPKLGTTPEEFRTNLIKYIQDTRSKGGLPILLSPIERRIFKNNQLYDSHGEYPAVVQKVAAEFKVPFIDMQLKSRQYILKTGEKESKKLFLHADSGAWVNYPKGIADNTHFSEEGAMGMARLAGEGIKELKLPLMNYLNN